MSRSLALALALLTTGCAHAPFRHGWVDAEGWASLDPANRPASWRRATLDALRAAVEKAGGVWVWSQTTVDDAVATRQRLRAASQGRVERYEIVSREVESGFARVRLRVWVNQSTEAEGLSVRLGTVRVDAESDESSRQAAIAVRQELSGRGFITVESSGRPDWIVRVGAVAIPLLPTLSKLSSARARVSLEASQATGAWLAMESAESSAVGPSLSSARYAALDQTAGLVSDRLVQTLAQRQR